MPSLSAICESLVPCLLVSKDIEAIVAAHLGSLFFNEVDGLENIDGILMAATTNDHKCGTNPLPCWSNVRCTMSKVNPILSVNFNGSFGSCTLDTAEQI